MSVCAGSREAVANYKKHPLPPNWQACGMWESLAGQFLAKEEEETLGYATEVADPYLPEAA